MRRRTWSGMAAALLLLSTTSSVAVGSSSISLFYYYFGFLLAYGSGTALLVSSFSLGSQQHSRGVDHADGGSTTTTTASRKNLLSLEECLNLYNQQQTTNSTTTTDVSSCSKTSADSSTVRFVDGSWFHKGPRNGRAEFQQGPRIPGAVYFDLDDISCPTELFPQLNPHRLSHLQPPPQLFAAYMDSCGMTKDHVVIVYGQAGCAFLPRVWFTFRHVMGHDRVYLMQASLQEWINHGGPMEENHNNNNNMVVWAKDLDWAVPTRYQVSNYYQQRQRHHFQNFKNKYPLIVTRHDIKDMLLQQQQQQQQPNVDYTTATVDQQPPTPEDNDQGSILILDPRGSSFVQHGHMPGAIHVPYTSLSEPHNPNTLLSVSALRELLRDVVVVADDPETTTTVVLSCGSGVSVCNLYLALEECGYTDRVNIVVYDGSWEEWRRYEDLPKILPTPPKQQTRPESTAS